jgi:hypothetical protein
MNEMIKTHKLLNGSFKVVKCKHKVSTSICVPILQHLVLYNIYVPSFETCTRKKRGDRGFGIYIYIHELVCWG